MRFSLRGKLRAYFVLMLLVLVVVIIVCNFCVDNMITQYTTMKELNVVLSGFFRTVNDMKSSYTYYFSSKDEQDYQKYQELLHTAYAQIDRLIENAKDEEVAFRYGLVRNMILTYDEKVSQMKQKLTQHDSIGAFESMQQANRVHELINLQVQPCFDLLTGVIERSLAQVEQQTSLYWLWNNICMAAGVICASVYMVFYSKSISQPIQVLADSALRAKEQGFCVEPVEVKGIAEINILTNAFNEMIANIEYYINEMKQAAILKEKLLCEENANLKMKHLLKETQLNALQEKINPHFLFNTLNMLYQTAYIEEANKTMEMLYATTQLLRYGIDRIEKPVEVAQEMEVLHHYIYIQEQRFGKRIEFVFDEEQTHSFSHYKMPALIIQPLVENAVAHGLANRQEGGKVIVRVYDSDAYICIDVVDNGCGMEEELIQRLLFEEEREKEGIGLRNVMSRLELFYSGRARVIIHSKKDIGTMISILLPKDGEVCTES